MDTIQSEHDQARVSTARTFPLPGTTLYKVLSDPEFKKTFHARVKLGNPWMARLYRLGLLPLLGLGGQIMLLTTRGRTSARLRDTPIGYFRIDGEVYVFSGWGKRANWYQNLVAYPDDVYVQIGFRRLNAVPGVVDDAQEIRRIIEHFVVQDPGGAHTLMGWDHQVDHLDAADFSLMIEKVLVVRFRYGEK